MKSIYETSKYIAEPHGAVGYLGLKNELKNNLDMAYTQVRETRGKHYLEHLKLLKIQGLVHHVPLRREKTQMLRKLRQSYLRNQSNPPQDSSV